MTSVPAPPRVDRRMRRHSARLIGVDAARGLALVGMMAAHIVPAVGTDGETSLSSLITAGRASALFAVLAGVGLALANGGRTPPTGRRWARSAASVAARAGVLVAVGLILGAFDSGVAVILVYYGLLFLAAIPLLRVPAGVLIPLGIGWAALSPFASQALRIDSPGASYDNPTVESVAEPLDLLREVLLTGYYPVFTWVAYLLIGLGLGRLPLRSTRVAAVLLGTGAAVAALARLTSGWLLDAGGFTQLLTAGVGDHPIGRTLGEHVLTTGFYGTTPTTTWWWLAISSPHSGAPLDLLHTTGTAVATLGLMLLVARFARPIAWPLAAIGSMTFTLYTAHVVLLSTVIPPETPHAYLVHVLIAFAIAMPWRSLIGRGPLEALAARTGRAAADLIPPDPTHRH